MKQSNIKVIKLTLIIILVLLFIFPFLQEIKFENFLNHSIEKTDLDWQSNSVSCIKTSLSEIDVIGFSGEPILMTKYQLQNLFVPIVLDSIEPWKYEFTLIYNPDHEMLLHEFFNERQIVANSVIG